MKISTKGLLRLWLAIALVWWVGWFIFPDVWVEFVQPNSILGLIAWIIFPPIVLYIIGRLVFSFYKGFMGDKES